MNATSTDQRAVDRRAWENPNHWSRRSLFGVDFAKPDTRPRVPKATPAPGWTINLAHPAGAGAFFAIVAIAVAGASVLVALAANLAAR